MPPDQFQSARRAGFSENPAHMELRCTLTDPQPHTDLFVRESLQDERENFVFPPRELPFHASADAAFSQPLRDVVIYMLIKRLHRRI